MSCYAVLRRRAVTAMAIALCSTVLPMLDLGARANGSTQYAPSPRVCGSQALLSGWSLSRLIEQLIVIPVDQSELAAAKGEIAAGVGGLILTGSPPVTLQQQVSLALKGAPDGIDPLVMTDEEGGAVQQLWPVISDFPSARTMGATMTPSAIEHLALGLGVSMRHLGLTMDLAPVADIDARPGPSATNADGTRSFSGDTKTATRDALAFATGLERAGVIPVFKHFPGLGGAEGNTDLMAASTQPWKSVERAGLVPFERAITAGIPAIMVSNAIVPGLSRTPASLSRVVITKELRGRLHFRGLVLTDSLSAVAITHAHYPLGVAAVDALIAGADMVLFNASTIDLARTTAEIVSAIRFAVAKGTISRKQIIRDAALVLSTKHISSCAGSSRS
ncbi:MAG TPA: glycoside hydrolase family 3 N-terminal domain-containing protein [Acidimicrobiales bacterium]|nr:glycoside hydrolase family 3 N-terminal domain-containing protein [Acidimicrobiales bacterium]